jgi:predicted permease
MRELWNRIRDFFRRDTLAEELKQEMEFHRRMLERDGVAAGVDAVAAAYAAHRQLGNVTGQREQSRERWGFRWLDVLQQDLRHTFRGLRQHPGFAAAVIITLGLGIGANSTMFGVVDRLMFRPLPYLRDAGTVHRVYLRWYERDRQRTDYSMEYTRYLDLRKGTTSFSQSAAFATRSFAVGTGEQVQERQVAVVSASFFDFFDARPAKGRYFAAVEDSTPRGADVAVLGYDFWMTQYGGREDVLGTTVQVGTVLCTIIGVAPRGFAGVDDQRPPALFMPITTFAGAANPTDPFNYFTRYNWGWMEMMVRRRAGVSVATASADLSNAYVQSWNAQRVFERSLTPADIARPSALASAIKLGDGPDPNLEARTALWVSGVAVIVLLIACANVANLFLARALRRRREIAVRLALGVSRGRLAAQFLTESLVLALIGSVAGVAVAQWGGSALRKLFLPGATSIGAFADWRTLAFSAAAALIAGLLTGIVPALLGARGDLASTVKAGAREGTYYRSRTRSALLVFQGALSVTLLVGAGLFVRSLNNVRAMRLGFDVDPVLFVGSNLRGIQLSDPERVALGRRLLGEAQALPDVEFATWVGTVPFTGSSSRGIYVAGIDTVRKLGRFTYENATPDYFKVMGTRILVGRPFNETDRAGTPRVAVVSEAMARVLWPGRDALGQCMRLGADTMPCTTVIGIAENARQRSLVDDAGLHYYLPMDQFHPAEGSALLLRLRGDPALTGEAVRKRIQRAMPGQAYVMVRPLRDVVVAQRRSWQFGATMFVAFGVLALAVAALGLYSVIAYNVAQRTHELGVRVALGAQAGDVARLVVGQGVRLAAAGVGVGGALALATGRLVEPLLFKESSRDPAVYAAVATLMLIVAFIASAVPARRASRADPNLALRSE